MLTTRRADPCMDSTACLELESKGVYITSSHLFSSVNFLLYGPPPPLPVHLQADFTLATTFIHGLVAMTCGPPYLYALQSRLKARREEEARRREQELLNARKAYFEERKQVRVRYALASFITASCCLPHHSPSTPARG